MLACARRTCCWCSLKNCFATRTCAKLNRKRRMYDNEKSWMKVQGSLWLFQTIFLLLPLFFCVNMSVAVAAEYCNNSSNFCFFFLFILCFSLSPNRYFATFPKMLWKQRRLMKQFELATFLAFLRFYPIFAKLCSNELKIRHGEKPSLENHFSLCLLLKVTGRKFPWKHYSSPYTPVYLSFLLKNC